MIVGFYAALSALFFIYLSLRVIKLRRTRKVSVGPAGDAEIERAMRVQANFAEYTPIALLMLALAEFNGLNGALVHALGAIFLAARFGHFVGFRSPTAPMIGRVGGMVTTFIVLAGLALVLLAQFAGFLRA